VRIDCPVDLRRQRSRRDAHETLARDMKAGFYTIMEAHYYSSLADNDLLIADKP
jgi:hypothetical protein